MSSLNVMPESLATPSPADDEAELATWGSCEILLVADRVAIRQTGSTHKVYRGWRFAATMRDSQPRPGTTLFSIPVDPAHLAASQSRYALVRLAHQGAAATGQSAAFSWSASSIGTADPFAAALDQAHRRLNAAGWTRDATTATFYAKPAPTVDVREEEAATTSLEASTQVIAASESTTSPGSPSSDRLPLSSMPQPGVAGLAVG